jgi:hypothetical protein
VKTLNTLLNQYPKKLLSVVFGTAVLICTSIATLLMMMLFSAKYLSPWDFIPNEFRPPIGSFARTLNDSFESGTLGLLLALVLAGFFIGQLILLAIGLHRTKSAWLPWKLSAVNLLVCKVSYDLCYSLNPYYPPRGNFKSLGQSISYSDLLPGIVGMLIVLTAWIILQYRLSLSTSPIPAKVPTR